MIDIFYTIRKQDFQVPSCNKFPGKLSSTILKKATFPWTHVLRNYFKAQLEAAIFFSISYKVHVHNNSQVKKELDFLAFLIEFYYPPK